MKSRIRHVFLSLSLQTHLLIIASLLALPAFGIVIHSGIKQHDATLNAAMDDSRRLAYSIASEQHVLAGNAEQLLKVLAQLPDVQNRKTTEVSSLFANILKQSPQYVNIAVSDRDGNIWASALPMTKPVSMKDSRTFKDTFERRRFSAGEYRVGRISGLPTIGFGYPLINARGEFNGVISVGLNFLLFNDLIMKAGLSKELAFTISDRNGVIIDRTDEPEKYIGKKDNSEIFNRMKNGPKEGSFIGIGLRGKRSIISYNALHLENDQSPYMYISLSTPIMNILTSARQQQIRNILTLSVFLLIALVLVLLIGKRSFLDRIYTLREVSQRVGKGDLEVRASSFVTGGELGDLAQTFDEMANKLAMRERSLLDQQQELHDLNRNLAQRVEEEIEKRLQQERLMARHARLAAIGEMIGAIAHQWRQPLATLGATIQSIRMAWERHSIDAEFLERAEADAQKQLYYMSDTIEDFRNFFSPDKIIEKFDVKEKISEVGQLVAAQFANSGVSLEIIDKSAEYRLVIAGYQNEFKQALLNLVSNAFDAIKDNDGAGQDAVGIVAISIDKEDKNVVIEVADNGCGIPHDIADKIFEPYFTSKSEGKGTGIGLYMSKLIVEESMGGKLSFTSKQDCTVFTIKLARDLSSEGDMHE